MNSSQLNSYISINDEQIEICLHQNEELCLENHYNLRQKALLQYNDFLESLWNNPQNSRIQNHKIRACIGRLKHMNKVFDDFDDEADFVKWEIKRLLHETINCIEEPLKLSPFIYAFGIGDI